MKGRVLTVAGGLGALGRSVVELARSRGASVASIDLGESDSSLATDFIALGGVNLSDLHEASKAIDSVPRHFGKLDASIHLAGGYLFERFSESSPAAWQRIELVRPWTRTLSLVD